MTDEPDTYLAAQGLKRTVEHARLKNGSMPAKQFYDSLPKPDQAKVLVLWQRMADHGESVFKKNRFRPLEDNMSEFKCDAADGRMIRFGCVRIGSRWLLLHGLYKPAQSKWPLSDVNQCYAVRDEHMACWEKGQQGNETTKAKKGKGSK